MDIALNTFLTELPISYRLEISLLATNASGKGNNMLAHMTNVLIV
jgi:hypothetical protein